MNTGAGHGRKWYRLDNAANIYPVIQHRTWTSMFRIVAIMRDQVDIAALNRALDKMRGRFAGYYVRLRRGLFWYYLEQTRLHPRVEPDTLHICPPPQKGELPFRIKTHENRIACEFAHYICDGGGGFVFMKTLLAQYLRELDVDVPATCDILALDMPPQDENWEDAFRRHARMGVRPGRSEPAAYHPTDTRLPPGMQIIVTGTLSLSAALAKARGYKASLTEYLTAVLIYVLYKMQLGESGRRLKPVKVSVPVNLRKYYPTQTLRNFSQYLNPGIDPGLGDFTFKETLEQVHHYFRYMFTEKNLNARMSQNVGDEANMAMRLIPLFMKKAAMRAVYEMTGERLFSSVLSNVGAVTLPEVMERHIERVDLVLATARRNAVECGVASFGDKLSISFTRSIAEPYVERMFFRALVREGLHVLVESNQL